ncbi:MAG: OmpA family protein [Hyphomicrobiales bacterium]|nr:OmpA family protein [Hyphomicrobiales bacterium]
MARFRREQAAALLAVGLLIPLSARAAEPAPRLELAQAGLTPEQLREQERAKRKEEKREDRREFKEERRDAREERRDDRREFREEKRDDRREFRGERNDAREERKDEKREFRGERREDRREFKEERRDAREAPPADRREFKEERRDDRRDLRDDRKDAREERIEDKREFKEEKREDRREFRGERKDAREERIEDKREFKEEKRDDRRDFLKAREERKDRRRELGETIRREKLDARDERRTDRLEDRLRKQDERLRGLRAERRERREDGRLVIEEPGKRLIIRDKDRFFIRSDENLRLRRKYRDVREERRGREIYTEFRRPGGVVIVTVTDDDGRVLRRFRRLPGGRESILFDNGPRFGPGFYGGAVVDLPRLRRAPSERYIVDADEASEEDIEYALSAGPVEELDRRYTLDEVRSSIRLRERMRSVDLDSVTFDFGSWELGESQYVRLESVAEVLKDIIDRNPDEVFLIEGHTDAVGSDIDNLSLSDRRAESVANVLQDEFNVPAENLVTQGYGEQYLKIETEEPERENRRVTVRRITPLLRRDADYSERR